MSCHLKSNAICWTSILVSSAAFKLNKTYFNALYSILRWFYSQHVQCLWFISYFRITYNTLTCTHTHRHIQTQLDFDVIYGSLTKKKKTHLLLVLLCCVAAAIISLFCKWNQSAKLLKFKKPPFRFYLKN